MGATSRHDAWQAGDSYDIYMGRWSRQIAPLFLDWLAVPERLDWLEVGCGTGALTAAVVRQCNPASVLALEPSEGFITTAQRNLDDHRVRFLPGTAASLATFPGASHDVAVAGLVMNFIPDRLAALREMKRMVRPAGMVAFYVWDYPGGGIQFMREFWTAAVALDPAARELTEDRRFPFCTRDGLLDLAGQAGLKAEATALQCSTSFLDFEDYWRPFTLGAGPAPGYCVSLSDANRQALKEKLENSLPRQADGTIVLNARAWAIRACTA